MIDREEQTMEEEDPTGEEKQSKEGGLYGVREKEEKIEEILVYSSSPSTYFFKLVS